MNQTIPDINYHIIADCNMMCRFCFARFKDVEVLGKEQSIELVQRFADYDLEKINFVGGEPLICTWLDDLIAEARKGGLTTSIITNGLLLSKTWLKKASGDLDWVGVSIDSLDSSINQQLGRITAEGEGVNAQFYLDLFDALNDLDYKTKVNTVVTSLNSRESFHSLIAHVKPDKWKVFQMLLIEGENDFAADIMVSDREFKGFLSLNSDLLEVTKIYPEYNIDMMGSYLMVDPSGRFFDNISGKYRRSEPILEVGIEEALHSIEVDYEAFRRRHDYNRRYSMLARENMLGGRR